MALIQELVGEVIHDSRGDSTIQVTVKSDSGKTATAAVPSGASKGRMEAATVDPAKSVELIKTVLAPLLIGMDPHSQREIDDKMIKQDATENKSNLGANTILGASLAVSRLAAAEQNLPLYRWIGALDERQSFSVPVPMMNMINGGLHADNNLDIQEFIVVPDRVAGYHNQLSAGKLIFSTLGQILRGASVNIPIGDEGGYAPNLDTNEMALDYIVRAIKQSGYKAWEEVSLALDVAASSVPPTFEISGKRYLGLLKDFPIMSIEDPFDEDDWQSWVNFKQQMEESNPTSKKIMLVGDDLFVTNPKRLGQGIGIKAANAILVKLNQIGTLSETLDVVRMARQAGYIIIVSHRSGDTLDDYIADFAVGISAQFIKSGAPNDSHPERMAKYRRLLQIEQELSTTNGR
jgi:enolase